MTVLIPAYKPDERLIDLIHRLQSITSLPIVVVDDGSGETYRRIFQAVKDAGCTVLTHLSNRGKGSALKTGFHFLQEIGETDGVVCADSDGQHLPEDIVRITGILKERDHHIVLGSRQFTGKVPLRSRIGNTITRAVYTLATGVKLYDTQTGLRGYSARMLNWLCQIPGERFEYEMNLLLEAPKAGYNLYEVPIETIYLNENKSSHFRPVADSLRVYRPVMKSVMKFMMSSLLSTVIDYILLFLIQYLTANLLVSVVGSRIISAFFNYMINRKYVFPHGKEAAIKTSLPQYITLAAIILLANYAGIYTLFERFGLSLLASKVLTESALFIFSYWVQKRLIFECQLGGRRNEKKESTI